MSQSKPKVLLINTDLNQQKEWIKILNSEQIKLEIESSDINIIELLEDWQQKKISLPELVLLNMNLKTSDGQFLQISSLSHWCKQKKISISIIALNEKQDKISKIEKKWANHQGLIDIFPKIKEQNHQQFIDRIEEILGINLITDTDESSLNLRTFNKNEIEESEKLFSLEDVFSQSFLMDNSEEESPKTQTMEKSLPQESFSEDASITSSQDTLKYLDQAIKENPNSDTLYCERGDIYGSVGREEEALNDYQKAIQLNPKSELAYLSRGYLYLQLGNYINSIKDLTKALKLNSNNAITYHYRGLAHFRSGDERRAKKDYDQAIKLKPDFSEAYNDRGSLEYLLGQTNEALQDYEQAIKYKSSYADAYYNRGNIYCDLGRFSEAIADYTEAINYIPNFASAYGNRGIAYYELDMVEEAIQDTTKAAGIFHEQQEIESYQRAIDTLQQMQ